MGSAEDSTTEEDELGSTTGGVVGTADEASAIFYVF